MTKEQINWKRAIFIDEEFDDALVKKLTPIILNLRQENNEPITVGINSPGGSLNSLNTLLELLTGPDQKGVRGEIITVATDRAYSSAANFLALGSYSVALKHSRILYHDVRYSGMHDVTPQKALNAAKSLNDANDEFSLRLADRVIRRLIWIYVDLRSEFEDANKKYPEIHKKYDEVISEYCPKQNKLHDVDMASFATCLFAKLSADNDELIEKVMKRLSRWIYLTKLANLTPSLKIKGSRKIGLLDGVRNMHKIFKGNPEGFKAAEEQLKLFLTLLVGEIASGNITTNSFSDKLEEASRDFILMHAMNNVKHRRAAIKIMLEHSTVFFGRNMRDELKQKTEEEKKRILEPVIPSAQLFWLFCALLCRELFEGEHVFQPNDAQLLGLVDEVAGGGPVESVREFKAKAKAKAQEEAVPPKSKAKVKEKTAPPKITKPITI